MLDSTSSSFTSSSIVMVGNTNDNDDTESAFSMLSDASDDDFSILSYCDDNCGEIELLPSKPCYMHLRNAKLNRNLDFAVMFSLAVVFGLGIGNFMGYSENCMQHVVPPVHEFDRPAYLDSMRKSVSKEEMLLGIEKWEIPEPLCAADVGMLTRDNISILIVENSRDGRPMRIDNQKENNLDLFHTLENDTNDIPPDTNLRIDLLDDAAIIDIAFAQVRKSFEFDYFQINDLLSLLQILHNGTDEVVNKMKTMVHSLITIKQPSLTELKMVEHMFDTFHLSIHNKIKELMESISSNNSPQKEKLFMKMANIILKAVDKLLEINFPKMLINDEKPIQSCLKSIYDSGLYVMRNFDEKWLNEKRRVMNVQQPYEEKPYYPCGKRGCKKATRSEGKAHGKNDKLKHADKSGKKHFEKKRF